MSDLDKFRCLIPSSWIEVDTEANVRGYVDFFSDFSIGSFFIRDEDDGGDFTRPQ
jgi:hypothetical protein